MTTEAPWAAELNRFWSALRAESTDILTAAVHRLPLLQEWRIKRAIQTFEDLGPDLLPAILQELSDRTAQRGTDDVVALQLAMTGRPEQSASVEGKP